MNDQKTSIAAFGIGVGLLAVGLTGIPFSDGLLILGSGLAAFAYALLFLSWRSSLALPQAGMAPPAASPTSPATPQTPSVSAAPQAVSAPSEQPPHIKPPTKMPGIKLPQVVIENRIPILLLSIGLVLVITALAFLFGLQTALGYGLLIPGVLFLGIGSVILFLRLYRRPGVIELKRFCMHCGFQMSSVDVYCGRCRRQPPSGVDTKVCPNCTAVIPTLAKFCRDCGAGQPSS